MALTTDQQAELEKAVIREIYFAEFAFASGTLYLSSYNQTITWGGHDWLGLGALSNISEIEESDGLESKDLMFTVNFADPAILALSIGPVEEYRGRSAKLYFCPLDDSYQMVGTPVLCWRGVMDAMMVGVGEDGDGQIQLKCETSAYGIKRQPALRINPAQHRAQYPGDPSFDYLPDLIANPQVWLSRRFQRV